LLIIVNVYFHKWIVLNQVYNMITSTLAFHILDKVTLYTWLPIGPRPLRRTWWRFFLGWLATGIKGLTIMSAPGVVWSLCVEYDVCGQSFQSSPHGEPTHGKKDEVRFTCFISMAWHVVLLVSTTLDWNTNTRVQWSLSIG
jgi:hypothetical protein